MLAYIYKNGEKLSLEEVSTPDLGDGVIIKVLACSICGTDIRTYNFGSNKIDKNRIIGHEMVGVIEKISPDIPGNFRVGDFVGMAPAIGCGQCRICKRGKPNMCDRLSTIGFQYDGGFAQYAAIPSSAFLMGNVYHIPKDADPAVMALCEPFACVINAQSYLNISPGENVVIFGGGMIGCMHGELALSAGAGSVTIIEMDEKRISQSRNLLSFVTFINGSECDVVEEVLSKTDGYGADVVIVACSSGVAQTNGLNMLAKCGRISLFGGLPGDGVGLDSNLIHYRELGVFGVHASTPAQNKQSMDMIISGKISAAKYITKKYSLTDIETAFQEAASGKVLKAVIVN